MPNATSYKKLKSFFRKIERHTLPHKTQNKQQTQPQAIFRTQPVTAHFEVFVSSTSHIPHHNQATMASNTAIKMNTTKAAAVTICPFCRKECKVYRALRYEYEIDGKIYKIGRDVLDHHVFTTTCFETHVKRMGGKIEPTYEKAIEDVMKHIEKIKKPSKILRIIRTLWSEDAAPSVVMDILEAMTNGEETEEITDTYGDLWEDLTVIGAVGWYARGSIKAVRTQRARKEKKHDESATSSSDDEAVLARRDLMQSKDEARNAEVATLKSRLVEMEKMVAQLLADIPDAVDLSDADIPDAVTYLNCYYCPNTINNIEKAEVIIDTTDNIKNLVCSFACEGIPDEMKDTCAYCGTLHFGKSDVCNSCWMTAHESCMNSD